MYQKFIEWLESSMGTCTFRNNTGFDCPGCGMQRAFIELLKGNLFESIQLFPALIPMIFTLLFLVAHLIFKFRQGAMILKISFIFTMSIIVVFYIYKFITNTL
jgi:hypothetical protein